MRNTFTRWVVLSFVAILLAIFPTTIATKHITLAKTKAYIAEDLPTTAGLASQPAKPVSATVGVRNHGASSGVGVDNQLLSLASTSNESTLLILGISFVTIALFLRSRSHIASTASRP